MSNRRSPLAAKSVCRLAAAVSLLMVAAGVAAARQGPGGTGPPPVADPKREMRDRQYSEARLRGAGAEAELAKVDEQRLRAGIKQTKEDFKRIQIIRNEMVDYLLAGRPLDYKLISDQTEEINKSASRLKSYLMPPVPEDQKKGEKNLVEFTDGQMKGALVKLCNLIHSFTQNPVLKNLGTNDVQHSMRAGGDLLSIIELSDHIRKSADRLKRAPR